MNTTLPLRDIELPEAVAWWPPAPGWWALAVALIALAVALALVARRRRRRARVRRAVLAAIDDIRRRVQAEPESGSRVAADVSRLLRRAVISSYPREAVAGLTGDRWLAFLDDVAARRTPDEPRLFRDGPARALATAPYRQTEDVEADALLAAAERVARALPDVEDRAA